MEKRHEECRQDGRRSVVAPLLEEEYERFTLPNGLVVLLKPDRSAPVCSVQLWIKTGSIHEGRMLGSGVSHFVEHMLFKGTRKRRGKEMARVVHEAGGYINAYTAFDRTVYYIDLPSDGVELALDVLGDAVFDSTFPVEEVEKEKEVINREIAMGEDDHDSKLVLSLMEAVFNRHNFRYPIIGYKDVFNALAREDLLEYYRARYLPNNAVLVVSGDFCCADMRELARRYFEGYQRRSLAPVFLPEEPGQLAERRLDLYEDTQITRVAIGFQTPGLSHADTPALDALALALGGGDSSLLYQRLREELKLVHAIDVSNWTPGEIGVFYVSIICDPDKSEAAVAELQRFLDSLSGDHFTDSIVEKVARQLLASEINSRKTMSGQASRLGAAEVVVGDVSYAKRYLEKISQVSGSDLSRVRREWLQRDRQTTVTLHPAKALEKKGSKAPQQPSGLDFAEQVLENGCRVLLRENARLPNVHFRIALQAGALFEPEGKQGLSALLATLMTKDTLKRSALEVAEAIEGAGGSFYEFSGNNSFGFALEVMPQDAELALDLIEELLLRPRFCEDVFELEKQSHIAGIKESLDDIVSVGRHRLRKLFFGRHPLAIGGAGDLDTVSRIALQDLRDFWSRIVVGGNVVIGVSGSFESQKISGQLSGILEQLPEARALDSTAEFSAPAQPGRHREHLDRKQAIVFHAYPSPGLLAEDYFVSEVADELFSGMSSELFERVREQLSLAYFVRSSRVVGLQASMFYLFAGTAPERYEEVVAELDKEVRRVAAGVGPGELERCKNRLKASKRMSMQTNSSCASQAVLNSVYGLPPNDWSRYAERIDSVSIDALRSFASIYFAQDNRVELVVGPWD